MLAIIMVMSSYYSGGKMKNEENRKISGTKEG
jgi:hypothetical protein